MICLRTVLADHEQKNNEKIKTLEKQFIKNRFPHSDKWTRRPGSYLLSKRKEQQVRCLVKSKEKTGRRDA